MDLPRLIETLSDPAVTNCFAPHIKSCSSIGSEIAGQPQEVIRYIGLYEEVPMSSQLGPLEICCDAPPYPIVQGCLHAGIQSPEDVRWLRISEFRNRQDGGQQSSSSPHFSLWKVLWGSGQAPQRKTCTCGAELPPLRLVVFTFNTGDQAPYLLGQCSRCRTVFWDEP
jgi:hypothetical protein